jgi:oligopeptide transport system substrate-binding protein
MRMGAIRPAALAALLLGGCSEPGTGPIAVSAIGTPPALVNPNLKPLDPASAMLVAATAQGLVRFDAAGQIEPALAESWTVSDDGRSYIFRLQRLEWSNGQPVTAEQVAARLEAAVSGASRNRLKPVLGAISEVEAMTERVIEIRLAGPRPNFLQLLAQPEMAIIRNGLGTGPYRAEPSGNGALALTRPPEEEGEAPDPGYPPLLLRGEAAPLAVARFASGLADLATGGTANELPLARVADLPDEAIRFDPVNGLFGLAFTRRTGLFAQTDVRRALSMAIDRPALTAALGVPNLAARTSLIPGGVEELPQPTRPAWDARPLPERQAEARTLIAAAADGEPATIRVAMPDGPGFRLLFAHLRRDWRAIGVEAEPVKATERPDLILIDEVAPAFIASWYLRRFTCEASAVCSVEADAALTAARDAATPVERQASLAEADRLLTELHAYIPLTAPVRWSLVGPRLTGFQPNSFGLHLPGTLVARRR